MTVTAPRILVVEDEAVLRMALEAMLGTLGLSVRTAPSGEAALEQLEQEESLSAVVLDLTLPGMSGTEVAEKVRSHGRHAAVPILFLSGDTRRGAEAVQQLSVISAARVEFLDKSASPPVLLAKIAELTSPSGA